MSHLTVNQIIEFVSLTELDDQAMKLISTVNGHIYKCDACLEKVKAFQLIYDEFSRLGLDDNFEAYAQTVMATDETETKKTERHLRKAQG